MESGRNLPSCRSIRCTTTPSETNLALADDLWSREQPEILDIAQLVRVLTQQLVTPNNKTQTAVLRWFLHLEAKTPRSIFKLSVVFYSVLLKILAEATQLDPRIVELALEVIAEICSYDEDKEARESFFQKFMVDVLHLFSTVNDLMQNGCRSIIGHLSLLLEPNGPEKIFSACADILMDELDLDFATSMVENLNIILLTSSQLFKLRTSLKELATPESRQLFSKLYRCWCHSPVAVLSLCLLSQTYDHACDLIACFPDLEITVDHLLQIHKLVQLIESPIFSHLRMQLLDHQRYSFLVKALYGLLMLLPQTEAFHTLQARLNCVPSILTDVNVHARDNCSGGNIGLDLNFTDLLKHFKTVQT